jgi:glycosyltransferase involved in cell wall biosynthesis
VNMSIVLPTRNRARPLRVTLDSLAGVANLAESCEIVIVDNGSCDDTLAVARAFAESHGDLSVRVCSEPVPGLVAGRHRGVKESSGEVIAFVDDDVRFDRTWALALLQGFVDSAVGMACGPTHPRFEVPPPAWLSAMWRSGGEGLRFLGELSLLDFGDAARPIDPVFVWGLNMAIRRAVLLELGGFHPDGVPWGLRRYRGDGETGLSLAARGAGVRAVYLPEARVHHVVPSERLTLEYMERRSYLQGISDSYTALRAAGLGSVSPGTSRSQLQRTLTATRRAIGRARRGRVGSPDAWPGDALRKSHDEGYAFHQTAFSQSQDLRDWVLKPDYWDYGLPNRESTDAGPDAGREQRVGQGQPDGNGA